MKYKKWLKENWLLVGAAGAGALALSRSQQASEKKLADLEKQMALAQDRKTANTILIAQIEQYQRDTWDSSNNLAAIIRGLKARSFNPYHNYSIDVPSRYDDYAGIESPEQIKVFDVRNRVKYSNWKVLFKDYINKNKHIEVGNEMDEVQYNKLLLEVVAALKLIKAHQDFYAPRFDWKSDNWVTTKNSALMQDNLHGAVRAIFSDIDRYDKYSFRNYSLMDFPEVLNWIGDQEAILKQGEMKMDTRMAWFDNPYFR